MILRSLQPAGLMLAVSIVAATPIVCQQESAGADRTISGTVYDTFTGRPIPFAVVRVTETESTTLTDRRGFYSLRVPVDAVRLEFRQVGFAMAAVVVARSEDDVVQDVFMNRLAVDLDTVVVSGIGESRATRIIRRAIARKNDVLERIQDYSYKAYVKLVISDLTKDRDSADAVLIITETETTAHWKKPDKYQEIITARRQTSNLPAEQNLVSVGQIVNFNRDRIDLEKYLVVSPTADDALDHYSYHLIDSLSVDDRKVYRLTIVPNTEGAPLFAGMIDVADSTFDVLAIDVRFNSAVRFEFFDDLRYRQRLRDYGDNYWMPYEITFSGRIHFGIPIPGVPRRIGFQHRASLSDFHFDEGDVPDDIGAFVVVVDEGADNVDSTTWENHNDGRLTAVEQAAYARIDSMRSRPASIGSRAATGLGLALLFTTNQDFFHFNRAESLYLGAGWTWRGLSPNVTLRTKLGYSFGRKAWQYEFGAWYRLSRGHDVWIGGAYQEDIVSRPTIVSSSYNPTYLALLMKLDPLDYFKE
ncbi:MAG: carboxypeptidase-like regulatory domain-containing protein, partial [Gemmatimonadota bacterium]